MTWKHEQKLQDKRRRVLFRYNKNFCLSQQAEHDDDQRSNKTGGFGTCGW